MSAAVVCNNFCGIRNNMHITVFKLPQKFQVLLQAEVELQLQWKLPHNLWSSQWSRLPALQHWELSGRSLLMYKVSGNLCLLGYMLYLLKLFNKNVVCQGKTANTYLFLLKKCKCENLMDWFLRMIARSLTLL